MVLDGFSKRRRSSNRPFPEKVICRSCGAQPNQPCLDSSGRSRHDRHGLLFHSQRVRDAAIRLDEETARARGGHWSIILQAIRQVEMAKAG